MHPADTAALVATLMTLIGRMQVLGAATDGSYRMHEAMSEALTTAAAAIVDLDRRLAAMEARCARRQCLDDRSTTGYLFAD